MKTRNTFVPRVATTFVAMTVLAIVATTPAFANRMSIDFQDAVGGDPATELYGSGSGLFMKFGCPTGGAASTAAGSCDVTGLAGNLSQEVQLGFKLTIGGTDYTSVFINENGLVTFGFAAPTTVSSATTIGGLQTDLGGLNFIAPSFANLAPGDSGKSGVLGSTGGIMFQRGLGLPTGPPTSPVFGTDPSGRAALSITWSDANLGDGQFRSQLVLYSLDPNGMDGSFGFRLNYTNDASGTPLSYGVLAGFSLAGLASTITEPFNPNTDYFFSPRATTVPEPSMLALLAIGLLGVFVQRRRQRLIY